MKEEDRLSRMQMTDLLHGPHKIARYDAMIFCNDYGVINGKDGCKYMAVIKDADGTTLGWLAIEWKEDDQGNFTWQPLKQYPLCDRTDLVTAFGKLIDDIYEKM